MSVSFNFLFKNFPSSLEQKMQFTPGQQTIAKIAVAIFAAFSAVYLCLKLEYLRQCVTVVKEDGTSYSTHIKNVNGKCKVIFNGYFASQATAEGLFSDGQLNGPGSILFPSGYLKEEKGKFDKGWLYDGEKFYRNGKFEKGIFNKDYLEGKGMRMHADGTIESGIFKHGKITSL